MNQYTCEACGQTNVETDLWGGCIACGCPVEFPKPYIRGGIYNFTHDFQPHGICRIIQWNLTAHARSTEVYQYPKWEFLERVTFVNKTYPVLPLRIQTLVNYATVLNDLDLIANVITVPVNIDLRRVQEVRTLFYNRHDLDVDVSVILQTVETDHV